MIEWLIDNTYVIVGNQVLRQTIGIPMGTDCAPFLANLFLFSYEFRYLNNLLNRGILLFSINFVVVLDILMMYC